MDEQMKVSMRFVVDESLVRWFWEVGLEFSIMFVLSRYPA
jgi:hypothetical protein